MTLRASGVSWLKLASSAIPFVVAPTGTMANNGAITLGTALPTTYANCYLNLPAAAISAGSAAGWYFSQMSSTTVGTVFNNTYTTGLPSIPSSPTSFVTTGPGAYTGVTTSVQAQAISLPAGSIGPNGVLKATTLWSVPNNANNKTINLDLVGLSNIMNAILTTVAQAQIQNILYNRGVQNSQVSFPSANQTGLGTAAGTMSYLSMNTAVAQVIAINMTMATATDFMVSEGFLFELGP